MDEQDQGANIGVWAVLAIILLLIFGLIGGLVLRTLHAKQAPKPAAMAAAPAAAAETEVLLEVVRSGVVVVRVFFELDQAALKPDAPTELAPAMQALGAEPAKKLVIAGFHDPSGDAAHNADLAKRRAIAVRMALLALGADAQRVQLRKPEQMEQGGPPEEARRVEVWLID